MLNFEMFLLPTSLLENDSSIARLDRFSQILHTFLAHLSTQRKEFERNKPIKMFYSQLLLSKKGALGIVWMAAHCHNRLKKDQVQQTNISSSVDKILDDEVPVVTHRILAFLLLGIVRIYSKKVEYLFDDCHEVLNRLCSFKTGKGPQAEVTVSLTHRHYDSIMLPKRFELDTFDLGVDLDAMGGKVRKVRARKQVAHTDGRSKDTARSGSFCKDYVVEIDLLCKATEIRNLKWLNHASPFWIPKDVIPIPEAHSTACTPPRDVLGAHHIEHDLLAKPLSNMSVTFAGVEMLRQTHRSLEDCVDLVLLDETEKEQMLYKLSNSDWRTNCQGPTNDVDFDSDSYSAMCLSNGRILSLPSLEMPRGIGFCLEDRLEPMVLDEAEQEQLYDRPSNSKVQSPIRDVELNSVVNQSHEESNPVENIDIHHDESAECLSNGRILSLPCLEIPRGIGFSLEDHLEPMVLDEAEQEQLYDRPSSSSVQVTIQDVKLNSVANQGSNHVEDIDMLHDSNFSLEHLPSFNLLNLAEKREGVDKPTNEDQAAKEKPKDHQSNQLSIQESVDLVFTEAVDNTRPACPELEVIPPEIVKCQKPENFRVSIDSIPKPHSKFPAADVGTVEIAAIQTPGRKERAKILKRKKALVDVDTVVSNMVMKSWIDDPTDLKRGRKKVPHTELQAWRSHKFCHAPHSFLEPSIPGVSVDFGYNECRKSDATEIISAELSVGQKHIPDIRSHITEQQISDTRAPVVEKSTGKTADVIPMEIEKPQEPAPDVRSPIAEISSDQIPIAPGTPVAYLSSLKSYEAERVADSDIIQPSASLESREKSTSSSEQLGLDALFQEETSSYRGDSLEKDAFSARTRMTVCYLGRKFLHKKRRNEEQVLNLSCLLAGKTKKESTIMFYEILVLKTQGCIDVQQETGYCDVLVRETPKLRQYFK